MTSIWPVSSIWCSICTTNAVSFPNLHWETDSQIRMTSRRWARRTAYADLVDDFVAPLFLDSLLNEPGFTRVVVMLAQDFLDRFDALGD